jgi:ArsR family transcriptional regulator
MASRPLAQKTLESRRGNELAEEAGCCGPGPQSRRSSGSDARLGAMERTFKALADSTRLRILALLSGGEICVCDIQSALGIPQPRASRHLAYLRRVGLVADRKDGLWVHYRLANPDDPVLQTLLSGVLHCLHHLPGAPVSTPVSEVRLACCGPAASGSRARR